MRKVISESEVETVDLKRFHEVLAVASPDDISGVAIYVSPRLAPFVHPSTPAVTTDTNYLLIVVENPDDPETIERLKRLVIPQKRKA